MLEVSVVSAFKDNYVWLVHAPSDRRRVLVVDPGDAAPVLEFLQRENLVPAAIAVTHRHADHCGGVATLRRHFDVPVFGPSREAAEIVTAPLRGGEPLRLDALGLAFEVLEIPGHTLGHIALFGDGALFCGDTLFSAGCGRLFEGTAEQMHDSLSRLAALPPATRVYCGHEYTAANIAFALDVEPANRRLLERRDRVTALRARALPSLPSTVAIERATNPFLRVAEPAVRQAAERWSGEQLDDKVRVFAALRRWKDQY